MQYEILPSVKLQGKTNYNWANNFSKGFVFECTPFCYYSEHTEYNIGSGGVGGGGVSQLLEMI